VTKYLFNRQKVTPGKSVTPPSEAAIKATPGLWHADLDDAIRYGGDVTRHVLAHMNLRGDRRHVIVDVKVHMLLPGFMPAIPGWHTDGVPRWDGSRWTPESGEPSLAEQEAWEDAGEPVAPRFHLYVSGSGCLTRFMTEELPLDVPDDIGTNLYAYISGQVGEKPVQRVQTFPGRVIEWDWWNLHTAAKAEKREWRYLCRVTETDHVEPQTDLRQILRTQEQVYVPTEFGW
jgi:hypothetical protein